ncbi:F-box protein At5g65850-like [Triticum dicoccoides]|uniref:F-box protein At5g65850-like n=1 Tax=Triticum dicoccoides TaxID=85692 RepID=UPI000E7C3C49|nr:F-box protein At5g65850-like [Triticum dicoccoides]
MDHTDVSVLPDDLVVEILSRLPLKSFCRFKCVCKPWLAFSSDPNYRKKLPKIPIGIFCQYQDFDKKATKLLSQPQNVEKIDGALSFLPHHLQLELMDCCNGLVLCMHRSMDWSRRTITCHFIMCNPATQEWTRLPDTRPYQEHDVCEAMLAFNPSCSRQFYVFNFRRNPLSSFFSGLEVFSSDLSTWLVYDAWWNSGIRTIIGYPHLFIDGSLYLFSLRQNSVERILVLNGFEAMSSRIPPNRRTIKLPRDHSIEPPNGLPVGMYTRGYFGKSRGAIYYALPEEDGLAVQIWSLDVSGPYKWTVKYRLSMRDAFGRDDLAHYDSSQQCWNCAYEITAIDLEREVIFLLDCWANTIRSYAMSNGELHELDEIEQDHEHVYEKFFHYVACYSRLPAYVPLPKPHLLETKRIDRRTWRSKLLAIVGKSRWR